MSDAKKCDICGAFFVPNNIDGTKLTGWVKGNNIDIRFKPGLHDDVRANYHSAVDMCNRCIQLLLTNIIEEIEGGYDE